jgi:hypothetical protein
MAKTWQSVLDESRILLNDTVEPYRYTDSSLLAILNRGLQELARLRPDAFWDLFSVDDVIVPEIVTLDADPDDNPDEADPTEDGQIGLSADFNIPMQFHGPLVYWTTGNAEIIDDEHVDDNRVSALIVQFKTQVLGL